MQNKKERFSELKTVLNLPFTFVETQNCSIENELNVQWQKKKENTTSIFLILSLVLRMLIMFERSKFARECWISWFQPWKLSAAFVVVENIFLSLFLFEVWLGSLRAHKACTNNILNVLNTYVHKNIIEGYKILTLLPLDQQILISKFNIQKYNLTKILVF